MSPKAGEQLPEDNLVTAKFIPEDDIDACDGDPMLGIFMHKLFSWAGATKSILPRINGKSWIGCSRDRWITERKPWGKKVKVSKHQFERMLARGRKMGVLETCQFPSRFEMGDKQWKTVLHVRPADGYSKCRTDAAQRRSDAGPMHGFCGADAGPVQDPDQDHPTKSAKESEAGIGVPADADDAISPPACALAEEQKAVAYSEGSNPFPPLFDQPSSPQAVTPKQLWKVWMQLCFEHHDMKLERQTEKQKGQLRTVIDFVLDRGLDPVTFVRIVIVRWAYLARLVKHKTDDVKYTPKDPCLGFTTYFLDHLTSVVQEEGARMVKEAKNDSARKAQREKDEFERAAAHVASERAHRAKLDAMAVQGAEFATKEMAVAAMYRCLGRGDSFQSIRGEYIRAFLSSWGGDNELNDNAFFAKYRHDLANGFNEYCETEMAEGEDQFTPSEKMLFPKAA